MNKTGPNGFFMSGPGPIHDTMQFDAQGTMLRHNTTVQCGSQSAQLVPLETPDRHNEALFGADRGSFDVSPSVGNAFGQFWGS